METKEDSLTDEEKRALRGSKFAPLPSSRSQTPTRLAHPGGPLTTNKAAALAKFLERKLQEPNGLDSIDPQLLELAVKNAKETVRLGSGASSSGRNIKHVDSFNDSEELFEEENVETLKPKKPKKKKNKKEKKKRKKHKRQVKDQECIIVEKPKKKLKM